MGVLIAGIIKFFVGFGLGIVGEAEGVGREVDPRGSVSHCATRRRSSLSVRGSLDDLGRRNGQYCDKCS